jgi:peptide methionine sulfoxide reductase msrA/msrB
MKKKFRIVNYSIISLFSFLNSQCQTDSTIKSQTNNSFSKKATMGYNKLTKEEQYVIINKGTDAPFTGEYTDESRKGTYICRQCNTPLYKSESKFHSNCGWPSFDDEIQGAVKRVPDIDGRRVEIICNTCNGHLGHVFTGEGFTKKNTRHCVNSTSMIFIEDKGVKANADVNKAIFAGGCFWGVEYYFQHAKGVKSTTVGYIGGTTQNPTYKEVCQHKTGHIEAMEVIFNPLETNFEELAKLFFEIHDPTQANGQGPDIGPQYVSAIFYQNDDQLKTAEKLINTLKLKGYNVVTQLKKASPFWPAEDYHQQYYEHKGSEPYCHKKVERF